MRIRYVDVPYFSLVLALFDVAAIVCLHLLFKEPGFAASFIEISIMAACLVVPAFAMGLYQRRFLVREKLPLRAVCAFALSSALAWAWITLMSSRGVGIPPAGLMLLGISAIVVNRLVGCRLAEVATFKARVVVIGSASAALDIRDLQERSRPSRFVCTRLLDQASVGQWGVQRAVEETRANEIVLFAGEPVDEALAKTLLACRLSGVRVSTYASFVEKETRRIDYDDSEAISLILSGGASRGSPSRIAKRVVDIAVSASVLLAVAPLMLLVAALVRLGDGGPVLYHQERIGRRGRAFRLHKFRTMRVDAEADGVARWASKGDRRITPVGQLLRRSRVDELPQLFNVLLGDMSLVGPRPERPTIVADLEKTIPLYGYRHLVPPGLTGWAQINYPYGSSFADACEKTRYDLYYLKNGSLIFDLVIMLQTLRVILLAEGAL